MIGSTALGITTPALMTSRRILEEQGYEMTCYHATGYGGRAFEEGIRSGMFSGVLDLTTHEITNQLFKGIALAGDDRLETAAANRNSLRWLLPEPLMSSAKGPLKPFPRQRGRGPITGTVLSFTHVRVSREEMRQVGEGDGEQIELEPGTCCRGDPHSRILGPEPAGDSSMIRKAEGHLFRHSKKGSSPRIRRC